MVASKQTYTKECSSQLLDPFSCAINESLYQESEAELTLYNKIERHYLAKLPDSEEAIITDNKKVIKR